ncbi:unnamed protein product, partial [Musa hybrid cultivar]
YRGSLGPYLELSTGILGLEPSSCLSLWRQSFHDLGPLLNSPLFE